METVVLHLLAAGQSQAPGAQPAAALRRARLLLHPVHAALRAQTTRPAPAPAPAPAVQCHRWSATQAELQHRLLAAVQRQRAGCKHSLMRAQQALRNALSGSRDQLATAAGGISQGRPAAAAVPAAALASGKYCVYCLRADGDTKYSRCAQCLAVCYCSKECQRAHWKAGHKGECAPV
jgi:hypothetical protein